MDNGQTAAFSLGSGADSVLLIHGFTGSPWEMRPLGEALAQGGFHVHCPRLPGHGSTPEAMLSAGHGDWLLAMEEAFSSLGDARRIFVAGLSVGALLSLMIASRHPARVAGLALLAPALRFRTREMWLVHKLRGTPVLDLFKPWITKSAIDVEDPDVSATAPVLRAFPSTRLRDVFALQAMTRDVLGDVRAPTLIAIARHDHVVDPRVGEELARSLVRAHPIRQLMLERGYHQIPRDLSGELVAREVCDFFTQLKPR